MQPLVSIIIPVRNGATTISQALHSAAGQTGPRVEVLLVDDHSTDDTLDIVRCAGLPNVRVLESGGIGAAAARNTGIREANGDYITRLDGYWDLASFSKAARYIGSKAYVNQSYEEFIEASTEAGN